MTDENTNIDDYTIPELMELIEIDKLTPQLINEKTDSYIQKFRGEDDEKMATFFTQVKEKLLSSFKEQTVDSWYENQYLVSDDPIQNTKITSRANKIQEFDGALKRERLAINQSRPVPFAQGEINPTLRNQIQKIINIDSTFRVNSIPALKSVPYTSDGIWSSTNFTAGLSETLNRVLSLKVYSVQIPYTWYNIPSGSNYFYYDDTKVMITPGNYTIATLKDAIDASHPELSLNTDSYSVTGRLSIETTDAVSKLIEFFKPISVSCESFNYINSTLGWIMGFREPCYNIDNTLPVKGEAAADLNGPKYFLLYVDEFNMNRINKGLVSIEERETKLDLPEYYKPVTVKSNVPPPSYENSPPDCVTETDKIGAGCPDITLPVKVPFFTQDLPRTLTQAQQYSVNQIIRNRKNSPNIKLKPPSANNLLALIPVKPNGLEFGGMLVENANSLTFNVRNYFGPVDIERLEVKLCDDKGNILDLNGAEWSFSCITTQLYQY